MTGTYNLRLPAEARAIITELARLTGRNRQRATLTALQDALRRARPKRRMEDAENDLPAHRGERPTA